MEIILTKRLIIEEALKKDYMFFLKLLNSPNWIKNIGDRGIKTKEKSIEYIQNSLITSYVENDFGLYLVRFKNDMTPIGICGFIKREYLDALDLGFAILPEYEGKGYAFEASKAIMDYGLNVLKTSKIYAITTEENMKSQNLLRKIGFVQKGTVTPPDSSEKFMLLEYLNSTKSSKSAFCNPSNTFV